MCSTWLDAGCCWHFSRYYLLNLTSPLRRSPRPPITIQNCTKFVLFTKIDSQSLKTDVWVWRRNYSINRYNFYFQSSIFSSTSSSIWCLSRKINSFAVLGLSKKANELFAFGIIFYAWCRMRIDKYLTRHFETKI